ncbi:aldo/keto reductase [Microbacterium sp. NPDC057407]|uniref:aldo/keto reductase n=1 Tax=Microbacterium sp. NPDC057407 TaxID=3346120 RepID=UPI00366D3C5F
MMSSPNSPALELPRLGYGAANLGNLFREISDEAASEILSAAWDSGVRFFDTAPHYGLGLSERRLGAFLRTKPRDEFVISTKVGRLLRPNPDDDGGLDLAHDFHVRADMRRVWDFSESGIRASLDESLERLGLDRVDVVYLHDPERFDLEAALQKGLPALLELRTEGRVTGVGIGSMECHAITAAVAQADLDVVMVAGRYTLLEQPANRDVLPACNERGTAVVAASIFNSGLLAKDQPTKDGRYEYGRVPEQLWQRLQRIADICRAYDVPLPAAATQFPLRNSIVTSIVVGASRPEQIRRNAELLAVEIPHEMWNEMIAERLIE